MPRDFEPEPRDDDVARCNDGNFSNNHNFQATCSGGDGVDIWLAPYGECSNGSAIEMSSTASCPGGSNFAGLLPPNYTTTTTTSPPTTTTNAAAAATVVVEPQLVPVPDVIGSPLAGC